MIWCIHHNDLDGVISAWIVKKYYQDKEEVFFSSVTYSQPPPRIEPTILTKIFIVDFSYKRDNLLKIQERYPNTPIIIIDHHESALNSRLEWPDNIEWILDTSAAGACLLVHQYFFPDIIPHSLIESVADYDGWKFLCAYTREINEALINYKHTDLLNSAFDLLMNNDDAYHKLIEIGSILYQAKMQRVDIMSRKMRMINFEGYTVPIVNCTDSINEVAQFLLDKFPDSPFCILYYDDFPKGVRKYSFRSRSSFDLLPVISKYGFNGHKTAAGGTLPLCLI